MAEGPKYQRPPGAKKVSRGKKVVSTVITLAVLALVFGFLIPRLGSYSEVFKTLGDLDTGQVLLLVGIGLGCIVLAWMMYWLSLPYLGFWQAAEFSLTSNLIASTLPAGAPLSLALGYEIIVSYGFDASDLALALGVSGIWNTFSKLGLPVVSVAILAFSGDSEGRLLVLALIGLGVLALAIGALAMVLWKPALARRCGEIAQGAVSWVLRLFKRGPVTGWGDSMVEFRDQTVSVTRHRWIQLSVCAMAGQLATFWLFLLCVRYAGIPSDVISTVEMFAVFTFARLVSSIPITPGSLGIAEMSYIGFLVAAGSLNDAQTVLATTGVLLFRGLTYLMPLPLGVVTYLTWSFRRKRKPGQPATRKKGAGP